MSEGNRVSEDFVRLADYKNGRVEEVPSDLASSIDSGDIRRNKENPSLISSSSRPLSFIESPRSGGRGAEVLNVANAQLSLDEYPQVDIVWETRTSGHVESSLVITVSNQGAVPILGASISDASATISGKDHSNGQTHEYQLFTGKSVDVGTVSSSKTVEMQFTSPTGDNDDNWHLPVVDAMTDDSLTTDFSCTVSGLLLGQQKDIETEVPVGSTDVVIDYE